MEYVHASLKLEPGMPALQHSGWTMNAGWLVAASAAITIALGLLHLYFTYVGNKLHPRDAALMEQMKQVQLVIARTSTWRAWIGFNASHSLGLILFGALFGYLSLAQPGVLFGSWFVGAIGLAALAAWLIMARAYWFARPLQAVALASVLYVAGWITANWQ